jgi:SAM-dependent methyltransferase
MIEYGPSTYGDRYADVYDEWHPGSEVENQAAVEFLAGLAGAGPALELGIGTGRIALPLAERGVEVDGIDASEAMAAKLRAKPGGDRVSVTIGDFSDVDVEGEYALVFVVFNTFFGLLTQDEQVRCFRNVAAHLADGAAFVMEVFVPDLTRFDRNQRVAVAALEDNSARLEMSVYDPMSQRVDARIVRLSGEGASFYPIQARFAWPSELDLMARLAGMRLRERWAGWNREPFTAQSGLHVSVYEKAGS